MARFLRRFFLATLALAVVVPLVGQALAATTLSEPADVEHMVKKIRAYHDGATEERPVLRVIYFYPSDTEPLEGYRERAARILRDIQDFYRSEMKRNGFGEVVFPLEIAEGRLRIHLVKGEQPANHYDYKSGQKIKQEIRRALEGIVNLDKEFVLVVHGLCRKEKDGSYFFHAPYYGDSNSNQVRGLCHVADCEMLDPALLTDTSRSIAYKEHYGTFNQTVAEFNTKYLGGIAHELGHGLSLPHNGQTREESSRLGTALMGAGNHTYRREIRGGKGSFLTAATAARLASHPLFTGSNRGREVAATCRPLDLRFTREGTGMTLEGKLEASPEVYAVIAYMDADGRSDYDAIAWVAPVSEDEFRIESKCVKRGRHALRLVACHVNGATSTVFRATYDANDRLEPNAAALSAAWLVREPEEAFLKGDREEAAALAKQTLLSKTPPEDAARKLRHLIVLATQKPATKLLDPAEAKGTELFLSDLKWASADVGWGQPARNQYFHNRSIRDAVLLETGGTFFEKGLYAHAPSRYVFHLGGKYKKFSAIGGLQTGAADVGSAVFVVKGDDRELFRSNLIKGSQRAEINLEIDNIDRLELIVESGKDGNASCWSIWGAPKITR